MRILTHCPSAAAFAIALGPPNPPLNSIAEETLDFRGVEFLSTLRLLIPTFSLPNAPAALAGQPSMRLECSPTTPMHCIGPLICTNIARYARHTNQHECVLYIRVYSCSAKRLYLCLFVGQCKALAFVSSVLCLAPVNFRRNPPSNSELLHTL